ncbi:MAG: hypothetical protein ABGZ35_16655 [Planctomycetaceae bacterium]
MTRLSPRSSSFGALLSQSVGAQESGQESTEQLNVLFVAIEEARNVPWRWAVIQLIFVGLCRTPGIRADNPFRRCMPMARLLSKT